MLGHRVPDAVLAVHRQRGSVPVHLALPDAGRGMGAGRAGFLRDVVYQIVDVQHVAGGKDAGDAGLQALVDGGAARHRAEGDAGGPAQLVFGQQAAGEQQGVTVVVLLGAGDGPAVFHPGQGDALDPLLALNVHHRVAELEGDAVVVQALDDVPLQAARIGHQLGHHLHLGPLPGSCGGP